MSAPITAQSDVLVIGGGMAAASSGVTATGGPNHWWVPLGPMLRPEAIEKRHAAGLGLGDPT